MRSGIKGADPRVIRETVTITVRGPEAPNGACQVRRLDFDPEDWASEAGAEALVEEVERMVGQCLEPPDRWIRNVVAETEGRLGD